MVDEPITPITGELRGLLADINWTEIIDHMQTSAGAIVDGDWLDAWHEAASNACNAIDAVHANLERENESLRRELDRTRGEWDYWESTHVELPKDADGVPIRVGDKVQLIGNDPSTVSHMSLADDGWRVYVKYDGGIGTGSGEPKRIRHHHVPTVEDVLREFAYGLGVPVADSYVAATAAKLRLADGKEQQ